MVKPMGQWGLQQQLYSRISACLFSACLFSACTQRVARCVVDHSPCPPWVNDSHSMQHVECRQRTEQTPACAFSHQLGVHAGPVDDTGAVTAALFADIAKW